MDENSSAINEEGSELILYTSYFVTPLESSRGLLSEFSAEPAPSCRKQYSLRRRVRICKQDRVRALPRKFSSQSRPQSIIILAPRCDTSSELCMQCRRVRALISSRVPRNMSFTRGVYRFGSSRDQPERHIRQLADCEALMAFRKKRPPAQGGAIS